MRIIIAVFTFIIASGLFAQTYFRLLSENELNTRKIKAVVMIRVVEAQGEEHYGTGFFINKDGTILTNYHVIKPFIKDINTKIKVTDYKGQMIFNLSLGKCLSTDNRKVDLCLLKANSFKVEEIFIPEKQDIGLGNIVYSIGHDSGVNLIPKKGKISKLLSNSREQKNIKTDLNKETEQFVTSITTNHGDSGSPLFFSNGSLIGIQTERWPIRKNGKIIGYNHAAISVNEILKFFKDSIENFKVIQNNRIFNLNLKSRNPLDYL